MKKYKFIFASKNETYETYIEVLDFDEESLICIFNGDDILDEPLKEWIGAYCSHSWDINRRYQDCSLIIYDDCDNILSEFKLHGTSMVEVDNNSYSKWCNSKYTFKYKFLEEITINTK